METNGASCCCGGHRHLSGCRALPRPGSEHKTNGGSRPTVQFLNCFPTELFPDSDFSNPLTAAKLGLSSTKQLGLRVLNKTVM